MQPPNLRLNPFGPTLRNLQIAISSRDFEVRYLSEDGKHIVVVPLGILSGSTKTVWDLKNHLEKETKIPVADQVLTYAGGHRQGEVLTDNALLVDVAKFLVGGAKLAKAKL